MDEVCIYSDDDGTSSNEGLMRKPYFSGKSFRYSGRLSEDEKEVSSELFEIKLDIAVRSGRPDDDYEGSWFSFDFRKLEDCVYVAIGDNVDSAMDALQWTLRHSAFPFTVVYLLHVFPEIRFVPSPLGMLPRRQVNPRLVEKYMDEEKAKRREFLQKFVDTCSAAQVKAEALLIESDTVAKAILNLIPIFCIRKLILGSSKARKWRSKRGRRTALQVVQNADKFCEVKIICEGKEANYQMIEASPSSSSHKLSPNLIDNNDAINVNLMHKESRRACLFSSMCFGF